MKVVVTGGLGFIGCNVAKSFAERGHEVTAIDNLSRSGVINNLRFLPKEVRFVQADMVDGEDVKTYIDDCDVIFHYAAQVAVTASIEDPINDLFENIVGSANVLEQARSQRVPPLVIFASTNKVYGDIAVDKPVKEDQPLSFCTPYGCSKGAADQYMLDYYRVYGIPTVVLRMSCIYGNRQMGKEEQGWLCHFMRNKNKPVTIYGDGEQVRDVLYIDDYVALMHKLVEKREEVKGQVFNVGGGKNNVVSVNQVIDKIGNTNVTYADWRPSDQRYYVSDIGKVVRYTGWKPTIGIDEGLERLKVWVNEL